MILHKYLDIKGAVPTVENCELKITSPTSFSDPFECSPAIAKNWIKEDIIKFWNCPVWKKEAIDFLQSKNMISTKSEYDKNIEYAELITRHLGDFDPEKDPARKYKSDIAKSYFICCFSSSDSNEFDQILMWSHYSDGHKGIRLHFDSSLMVQGYAVWNTEKVIYSNNRISLDIDTFKDNDTIYKTLMKIIKLKSKSWEYENEFRAIMREDDSRTRKEINGTYMYFQKFNPKALMQIDFGINCPEEKKFEIVNLLNRDDLLHVKLYESSLDDKEFKLNFHEYKRTF